MEAVTRKPRIVTLREWTAAGLMYDCPNYGCDGIGETWRRLGSFIGKSHGAEEIFGIRMPRRDGSGGMCYWAAVRLMPGDSLPPGLDSLAIPTRQYAVWPFFDDPQRLPAEFGDICAHRLLEAGLHQDPRWLMLERYPQDWLDEASHKVRCSLFVAIS